MHCNLAGGTRQISTVLVISKQSHENSVAIMSHEPGGNQTDVLRPSSIQKRHPWKGTFVGDPDPDLRAQQYVPLLLQ